MLKQNNKNNNIIEENINISFWYIFIVSIIIFIKQKMNTNEPKKNLITPFFLLISFLSNTKTIDKPNKITNKTFVITEKKLKKIFIFLLLNDKSILKTDFILSRNKLKSLSSFFGEVNNCFNVL